MIKDNKILKYGIKKLSFGIVSIAVGAVIFLSGDASAHEEILTKDSGNIEKVTSKNSVSITEKNNISKGYNIKSSNKLGIEETKEELKIEKNLPKKTELNTNISNISEIEIIKNKNGITGSNSLNHNLNVIDKRVDDSSDIASLLTKVINKNSEENKVIPETVENTEEFVEKGTKIISRLTSKYAEDIARGYIGLEGGKYDSLIYKKAVLNPDGDDDGDGIANKDELYIYKKDGRTYLGYDIHPRLADTDGDGLNDKVDKDKLIWNISARDMAMFINLVYENDKKIDDILRKQAPVEKLSNNIQKMANNELGPYWRVKETYHQDNGLDAVLFETTNNFPFLKGDKIQVLAFAGTNVKQAGDLKADLALFFGNESNQSEAAIQLMKKIKSDSTITNLYITGHSLGGYLSLRATATAEKDKFGKFKQTYTFNAPKVKSGWFWGVPKDDVKISEELAKTGKIKNYYTDNDNIIPGNLQPSNKISIGRSAGAHSSTSYFESRVNSNSAFNFGKRQGMDGVGYRDENINKLSIIDPEKGTLSKTFLPTLVDDKPVSIMIGEKIKDRDVLNKINRDLLPVNIKLTVVSTDELTTLGLKHARVKVSYLDDNTSNNIDVPIFVTEADKKELISVVNAAKKLVESVVDLSDKTVKSVENYNRAKYNLTKKLEEAATTVSSSLTPQLVINNITKEVANLGMSVINTRAALELTEAGKYEPRVINDEKILLHHGSSINLDTVINKIFKDNIPQNTNYEILNSTEFGELGDIVAKVKVTYSDNSFDIVNIPIRIYTDSKGDSLIQEENPELVISEKGESLVQEENPELVISEKGEALVQEENPELVISEKGESLVQEEKPRADLESLKTKGLGVEVELLSNIKNISLNVKVVKNSKQLTSISKALSVEKNKIRVLDLKLTKNASVLNLNNKRIVRISLLENESDKINIYHVEKNGKLTFVSSEVKNKVVQFNIDHFSLFAIVDFSKTIKNNEKNEQKQIISESKKQQKSSTDIKDRINIGNEILNSKTIKMSNLNEKKEKIDNNLFKNGRIVSENIIESNNNFKPISILPKTGDSSSSRLPIIVEVGLIIGVLGIRKYNR